MKYAPTLQKKNSFFIAYFPNVHQESFVWSFGINIECVRLYDIVFGEVPMKNICEFGKAS